MRSKKFSLKGKILSLLFISWLLPVVMMILVFCYYMVSHHYQNVSDNLMQQLQYNADLCIERIDNCTDASRQASYDQSIQRFYNTYLKNIDSQTAYAIFRKNVSVYLSNTYQRNNYFQYSIFYMYSDPSKNSSVYNVWADGSQTKVNEYFDEDHERIVDFAKTLDTRVGFYDSGGRLYMVRNMKNSSFKTFGVLIMRLNESYIFGNLYHMPWCTEMTLNFADLKVSFEGDLIDELEINDGVALEGFGYIKKDNEMYTYYTEKEQDYNIKLIMQVDNDAMTNPFYGYPYVVAGLFIMMIPLLLIFIRTYLTHVTRPVKSLMDGSSEIEKGNLGYRLENKAKSREFYYLEDSFNNMSNRLKEQFEHIYKEEIAIRDARIMALQSHINPHFMNNTLEIINWEARLNGDVKVSKMIEALGTLMDAAIDRKKRSVIRLSEEMIYVNSYLYITSERLGKRLKIEKHLPDAAMDIYVPRLILQPVIENAIEHGIIPKREGTVLIQGYVYGGYLYLDIINDGTLSDEDRAHVGRLLNNDYEVSQESSGNMGIANVHQRLRIIYGEECGLFIDTPDEGHVRARLKIRIMDGNVQPDQ